MFISKIRLFFIIISLTLIAACNRKNDVIPDTVVDFTLQLTDPQFVDLNAIGGCVAVDSRTNNWGRYAAGFAESGIIVSRGVDEFYAYDRTCPHDYEVNGVTVRINIDPLGFAKAKCPQCGTSYELISYGTPTSGGPGRYPLKNYKTSFNGGTVRVWNNY